MEKSPNTKGLPWGMIVTFLGVIGLSYFLGSKFNCNEPQEPEIVYFPSEPTYITKDSFIHDTVREPYRKVNPTQTDYEKPVPEDTTFGGYIIGHPENGTPIWLPSKPLDTTKPIAKFSERFLTAYPENPKLLRSKVAKHLLSFDFLMPSGYPRTVTYPVDLDNYTYTWEMGGLKATILPRTKGFKLPKPTLEAYTDLTYNPVRNSSRLALNGTISFGKFGITSFMSYTTNTGPAIDAGIGTRFKIK